VADNVIEVEELTRTYQTGDVEVPALRGVTFTIERGDFVAIMGPSGSGKSTTMNLLGCLDQPTRGSYRLDGVEVSTLSKDELAYIRNLKIGFVFQGFNLLARTSALENCELPMLYSNRWPAKERVSRATASLQAVGLGHRLDHVPTQLSGGEQQRVAIARALVNEPAILLADEPTGNLDSKTSVDVMRIFQELNERQGITIILVTHEPDIAQFSKRVITFRDGRIRSDTRVENRQNAAQMLAEMQAERAAEESAAGA
jgi:putative ABC transport system ATP-binding protein